MRKRKRQNKRSRSGQGGPTRPGRQDHRQGFQRPNDGVGDSGESILDDVRAALASGQPSDFLSLVSALMAALDPRGRNPFEPPEEEALPSLSELISSFVEVDLPETTALLAGLAALDSDDLHRAKIRRELRSRSHPLPGWFSRLDEAEVHRVIEMADVLGDGDNH